MYMSISGAVCTILYFFGIHLQSRMLQRFGFDELCMACFVNPFILCRMRQT